MMKLNNRPKTLIIDIDGTLLRHCGDICKQHLQENSSFLILNGTLDFLRDADRKGYNIILLTGRREGVREATEKQLSNFGIIYDQLIMGVGGGERIIINDMKEESKEKTCRAINIKRNEGLKNVKI